MLRDKIRRALVESLKVPNIIVTHTKDFKFGEYTTNVAFRLASEMKCPPDEVAKRLVKEIKVPDFVDKVQTVGGYINFYLKEGFLRSILKDIVNKGENYGRGEPKPQSVLIEFVSANPTGPLNVVNGRAATVGDTLVRTFGFRGYNVASEYYVNDAGRQVQLLGESIKSHYYKLQGRDYPFPEDGYRGDYVRGIAQRMIDEGRTDFVEFGVSLMVEEHKRTLERFGVRFDYWIHESKIREIGIIDKVLQILKNKGLTYEYDGALWLKTSKFGDDKDRVIIKKDGEYTYFLPDIAYHLNKIERGFDKLINLWGPDHYGYVPRMKAAIEALGYPKDTLEVLIIQQVTLLTGGGKAKMSKREGRFVTLSSLIDEIGTDAARFFFLMRKWDKPLEFDVELAKQQSMENPVYYVQYAYVRTLSILRKAEEAGISMEGLTEANLKLLKEKEELDLIRQLIYFPEILEDVVNEREPHLIVFYLMELARNFHHYYEHHRVLGVEPDLSLARLCLIKGLNNVFGKGLELIGVSRPTRM